MCNISKLKFCTRVCAQHVLRRKFCPKESVRNGSCYGCATLIFFGGKGVALFVARVAKEMHRHFRMEISHDFFNSQNGNRARFFASTGNSLTLFAPHW
jgi:hypothetical protein